MSYPMGLDSGLSASRESRDNHNGRNNQSRGGNRGGYHHNNQMNDGRDSFGRDSRDSFGRDNNDYRGGNGDRRRYSGGDYDRNDNRRRYSNERNDYHQHHHRNRSPNYRANHNRNNRYNQGNSRDNKAYRAGGRGRGRGRGKPRVPGNIVQKSNIQSLPDAVGMGKALLTALCDYTLMETTDDIPSNILQLSEVFVSSGDLDDYADEYSDLFVKSFGQLSVQVPIVSTLLALISKNNREFTTLVLDKLCFITSLSINEGDILVSKLALRGLASLCSCNVLAIEGEGGLISVITPLLALMDQALGEFKSSNSNNKRLPLMQTGSKIQIQGSLACYLVASTLPYCAEVLHNSAAGKVLLLKCAATIREVEQKYKSPFDVGGTHAIVHENVIDEAAAGEGPNETSVWDNLWSACHAATESINKVMKASSGKITTTDGEDGEEGENDGATVAYNKSSTTFEGLLVMPWLDADIKDALDAEPVVMVKKDKNSQKKNDSSDENSNANADGDTFAATQIDPDVAVTTTTDSDVNNNTTDDNKDDLNEDDDDEEELIQMDVPFHITLDADVAQNITDAITNNTKPAFSSTGGAGCTTLPGWLCARFAIFDVESWPAECAVPMGWRATSATNDDDNDDDIKEKASKKGLSDVQLHYTLEYLRDILRFFDVYTKDDGTKVGSMDIQMKHCTAVESLLARKDDNIGIKGLLIELLLNKCVQSGVAGGDSLLQSRLLVEMVKKDQENVPSILAAGAGVLYRLVPAMDTGAWRELAQWITYHLVNFRLAWPYWTYWGQDYKPDSEDGDQVTRSFIKQVVDKTARLLFPERVRQHVPGDLYDCIPDCQKIEPACPVFATTEIKTSANDTEGTDGTETKDIDVSNAETIATQVLQHVEARDDNEDMKEFLDTLGNDAVIGYGEGVLWKAKFLLMACLVNGKKAPSSVFALFDKYGILLKELVTPTNNNTNNDGNTDHNDEGELELLKCLIGCYPQDIGNALIFVRAAIEHNFISSHIVAKWAVSRIIKENNTEDLNAEGAMIDMNDYSAVLLAVNHALNQVRTASVALRNLTAQSEMETEEEPNKVNIAADMSGAVTNVVGGRAPFKADETNTENNNTDDAEVDNDNNDLNTSIVDEQVLETLVDATKTAIDEAHLVFSTILPALLIALHTRYSALGWSIKAKSKRSRDTMEEDDVYHLDSYNITGTSLIKHVMRLYKALEQEVDSEDPLGDIAPLLTGAVKSLSDLPPPVATSLQPYLSK